MDIDKISSINCYTRNNYDKKFCNNLNPNKLQNFLKPYEKDPFGEKSFFDKNKFSLINNNLKINNISKEECAINSIENNYAGFTYKGDNNKCLLFSNNDFNKKLEDDNKKYNIKTFIKTNSTVDIKNIEDQHDSTKYFTESNNNEYISDGLLQNINVKNKLECMDECIKDYTKCKSIMYLEQPKECNFYKDKIMKKKSSISNDYDTYTIRNTYLKENINTINKLYNDIDEEDNNYYYCTLNNNKCLLDYKIDKNIFYDNIENNLEIPIRSDNTNIPIYKCNDLYSTNPFCTKEYNPYDQEILKKPEEPNYTDCTIIKKKNDVKSQNIEYDNLCKKKFGDEYIYDNNIFDLKSIVKCDDNIKQKVKCKINFSDDALHNIDNSIPIEHFSNNTDLYYNNYYSLCIIKIICLLLLILFVFIIIFILFILLNNK
jgi:hypothetical protein